MVESEAKQLSEDQMRRVAHQEMQVVINAVNELKRKSASRQLQPEAENNTLKDALTARFGAAVADAYKISEKCRYEAVSEIKQQATEALAVVEGLGEEKYQDALAPLRSGCAQQHS